MSHDLPPSSSPNPEVPDKTDVPSDPSNLTPQHIITHFSPSLFRGLADERWEYDPILDDPEPKSDHADTPVAESDPEQAHVDSRFSPLSALERQRMKVKGIIGGTVIHLVFKQGRGTYKPWYRRLGDDKKSDE